MATLKERIQRKKRSVQKLAAKLADSNVPQERESNSQNVGWNKGWSKYGKR